MQKFIFFLILTIYPFLIFSQWAQIGNTLVGDTSSDRFGESVSISSDGNIVVVGANASSINGNISGLVRIYEENSGVWTQLGSDIYGNLEDREGTSVSISADGNIIAIGARWNDGNGADSGRVRVFENISGVWTQIGTDINGEGINDQSGHSVSLNSDGSIVAIGAPFNNNVAATNSGHVRVYKNISGVWTQLGADIDAVGQFEAFGHSVSLNSDGTIVAVGANKHHVNNLGTARIYRFVSNSWTQIGSSIIGENNDDRFGESISLSGNGNIVAIGAERNDGNGGNSGHVRVFENITEVWTQIGSDIDGETSGDFFGTSVSLSGDGRILAVGANGNDDNGANSGHTRIFENISGTWTQVGSDIDGLTSEQTGTSVGLSNDGSRVVIGGFIGNGRCRIYENAILSVSESSFNTKLSVYPNPTFDKSTIQLGRIYSDLKVHVYDVLGNIISTTNHRDTDKILLKSNSYQSGIYIIKIQSENQQASLKLVVK